MDNAQTLLRLYRDNACEIARLEEDIERWRSRAERVTAAYSPAPAHAGDDRVQAAVDALDALREELLERLRHATATRRAIQCAIDSVEDTRLRLLLEYYYLDGLTWEAVAERMGQSLRHTLRLRKMALDVIVCHC